MAAFTMETLKMTTSQGMATINGLMADSTKGLGQITQWKARVKWSGKMAEGTTVCFKMICRTERAQWTGQMAADTKVIGHAEDKMALAVS